MLELISLINSGPKTLNLIDDKNKPLQLGGDTSGVLRYPHLIKELIRIKKLETKNVDAKVLILGPGLAKVDRVSSPQLSEILAAFPKNAHVTVVDINEEVISQIAKNAFGPDEKRLAQSVLTLDRGYNVCHLKPQELKEIKKYVKDIPENVSQKLEVIQQDFSEFKTERKYNYIFAIQSLMYTLINYSQSSTEEDATTKSKSVVDKYLKSLSDRGTLVLDGVIYELMQKYFESLPKMEELEKSQQLWKYDDKNFFEVRKVKILNSNGSDKDKIFFLDKEKKPRWVTTCDLYLLTR